MFLLACIIALTTVTTAVKGDCEANTLDCSGICADHQVADGTKCIGFAVCAEVGTDREHLRCLCPRDCNVAQASATDGLSFIQRRERIEMEKKRHEQAQESLEEILSQELSAEELQEKISVVFTLLDTDENELISNKERQFLFKDAVDNAVELIFGDAQTLTVEEWCAVEFDVVPRKLAPSSDAEQQMICQWEEDVMVDDCAFDFQLLTENEVLTRGQMTDYYYILLNPSQDWTVAQLQAYFFNSKRNPLQKIFSSQVMDWSNVNTVTEHVNDCSHVATKRRALQISCAVGPFPCAIEVAGVWGAFFVLPLFLGRRELEDTVVTSIVSTPVLTSIVSNLASTDDCEFTNCPELQGMLGMLQHYKFCEEGVEEGCVWIENLFMPTD